MRTAIAGMLICLLLMMGCQPAGDTATQFAPTVDLPAGATLLPTLLPDTVPLPSASATTTRRALSTPLRESATPRPLPTIPHEALAATSPSVGGATYCLWPGDTLYALARAAQVDLRGLQDLNPGRVQYAGATIQLPANSLPPDAWALPTPAVAAVQDLPFGVSGYYLGADNRHKRVALTFDIGFVPENQTRMAWLHDEGIPATFFVLGSSVARHPEMVTAVLANGHQLGNHSWDHRNFQSLSIAQIRGEIQQTEDAVQAALPEAQGAQPAASTQPYLRAPFGAIDARVIKLADQMGYRLIGWTVDSRDWEVGATGDSVYQRVTTAVCPGAIIIMHDANPANLDALPRIIAYLRDHDYEIVPLADLLGADLMP